MNVTKMCIPDYVTDYIDKCRKDNKIVNHDRLKLFKVLEKNIFPKIESGELYFDEAQIEQCIKFSEKWYFEL